ncbi:MAG: hypothetical protein KME12_18915 [Trichocoleus desertorum ATA4-8-CV12]|jgi:hypothetical protein|nr:hypothetical protein [Trichocoleus desertorum ATA4-8-CV12]
MEIDPAPQLEKTALINQLLSELYNLVEILEAEHIKPDPFQPHSPSQADGLELAPLRSPIV